MMLVWCKIKRRNSFYKKELQHIDQIRKSHFQRVYSSEIKTSLTSTTTGTTRRPTRCQAEGKASSKIKATAEPAGVIDMLAPPSPRRPRVYSLRGSWRPFLLSFNLTFPANGQPGVNSTALIATRQSPTDSVRTTEKKRERGRERKEKENERVRSPLRSLLFQHCAW